LRTITYGRPYHAELLIAKEVARACAAASSEASEMSK
jgi:hypothetical protein